MPTKFKPPIDVGPYFNMLSEEDKAKYMFDLGAFGKAGIMLTPDGKAHYQDVTQPEGKNAKN